MGKLTGYEIRFDLEYNRILVLKTPNVDDERAIAIEIRAANSAEWKRLKAKLKQGVNVNFVADVQILS